jgi:hypothetical protein
MTVCFFDLMLIKVLQGICQTSIYYEITNLNIFGQVIIGFCYANMRYIMRIIVSCIFYRVSLLLMPVKTTGGKRCILNIYLQYTFNDTLLL